MSNDIAQTNAREKALMEEEKWLIENLKKIRVQRNALKVEGLYFQGLKAEVFTMHNNQFGKKYLQNAGKNTYSQNAGGNSHSQNAGNNRRSQINGGSGYSKNAGRNNFTLDEEEFEIPEPVGDTIPSNIDEFKLVEERCNEIENLNLNIIPDNKPNMDMMEPEYDTDEEEDDWYKIPFDMSVLVSGHCNQFQSDSN